MAAIESTKCVGVDIGKTGDPPAAVELSRSEGERVKLMTNCFQFPLGLKFPDLVNHLKPLALSADIALIDGNGIGAVVIDYLREDCRNVWSVITTGGKSARPQIEVSERKIYVPKSAMVEALVADIERARLELLPVGDHAKLLGEMADLQGTYSRRSTTIKYEAKAGSHDDLVMALAIARMGFGVIDVQQSMEGQNDADL